MRTRTFRKRRIIPRENWLPLKVAEAYVYGNSVKVVVAADSPELFEGSEAFRMAKRAARRNGYLKFKTSGKTQVFGQNHMCLKDYYFTK